jgi:hypothetical protein
VEVSKLKLEIYDFLGVIIPGLLLICEAMILVMGWPSFLDSITHVSGIGLTLLILLSFGVGNLAQELGHVAMGWVKGERYAQTERDRYWCAEESEPIKQLIKNETDHEIKIVDAAYDYCLTRIETRFPKRDLLVAVSDMSRSFTILSVLAIAPAYRFAFGDAPGTKHSVGVFCIIVIGLLAVGRLSWLRMVRFRGLSDTTVFRVYFAVAYEEKLNKSELPKATETHDDEDD